MMKSYLIILGAVSLFVFAIYISLLHKKADDHTVQVSAVSDQTKTASPLKNTEFNGILKNPIMHGKDGFTTSDNVYLSKYSETVNVRKDNRNEITITKNTQQSIEKPRTTYPKILRSPFSTSPNDVENTAADENNTSHDYALDTPTNLTLKSVSSSEITLGWEKSDGAAGYNIYYCEDKTTYLLDCKSVNAGTNKMTLHNLNPEAKYEIDVVAFNMEGNISDSSKIMFAETLIEDSDLIEIPDFYNNEFLVMESTCYNDCANTYAIKISQDFYFDFSECTRRCKICNL